ncbi:hypothetical protein FSP39_007090 [Pinctada imbricata]|uniref:PWWP domain-containing protein n=1 Tax=Pinctada imbricata TaxID=66713 RepID=A0AA88XZL0_PINIB|nr:hypothetical protein FSP39_007090 [Pinctada imbricata]
MNCSNTNNDGVSLHFFPTSQPILNQWNSFVKTKSKNWHGPTKYSVLCSDHFDESCYPDEYKIRKSMGFPPLKKKRLKENAVPTIQKQAAAPTTTGETDADELEDLQSQWIYPNATSTPYRKKGPRMAFVKRENSRVRHFRGILLDASKRNIPHGLCTWPSDKDDDQKQAMSSGDQTAATELQAPATTLRHTYLKPSENTNNLIQYQFHKFPRPFKDRPARNIRLRPRSTLCSKCKAVCQETEKGIIPIGQGHGLKQEKVTTQNNPQPSYLPPATKSPLREGLRKATRASPCIKINVGEGTVLKIPPRLHDEVDGESNTSQVEDNVDGTNDTQDSDSEKKTKKTVKKMKEKLTLVNEHENNEDAETVSDPIVTEIGIHHKKHKRKHRHKRDSIENEEKDTGTILEAVDENGESPRDQFETQSQRPRLLYTWRHHKGLSPRRENTDSNIDLSKQNFSPKQGFDSGVTQDLSISVPTKIIVRQKSVDIGPKKEYKLRSREKRISTDSSESIRHDHNSGSEFDKYSLISSATEDESESAKSADEADRSSVDEESLKSSPVPTVETTPNVDVFRSLMMKIHTRDVTKCIATDGRTIHVGDIVWGKIKGFPWWPGRVLSISVSERESGLVIRKLAHVSWFGSSTMSHIQCSDLYPFLEDFKLRYNRKKRGPYKVAIKQATIAAQSITNTHHIDFSEYDL